jgi:hypothetical protein
LAYLGADGIIILKRIKEVVRMWAKFTWLRIMLILVNT